MWAPLDCHFVVRYLQDEWLRHAGIVLVRFRICCEHALSSTLALVSKCSGFKEAELEKAYRSSCEEGGFKLRSDLKPPEEEDEEAGDEQAEPEDECFRFIQGLRQESAILSEESQPAVDLDMDSECAVPDELKGMPDQEQMENLLDKPSVMDPFRTEQSVSPRHRVRGKEELPTTLTDAMSMKGCMFNALFRLSVRLRSSRGGLDTGFIANARNARKASRSLNWHQRPGNNKDMQRCCFHFVEFVHMLLQFVEVHSVNPPGVSLLMGIRILMNLHFVGTGY